MGSENVVRVKDWDHIDNPATGERLRLLGRHAVMDSLPMEVTFSIKGRRSWSIGIPTAFGLAADNGVTRSGWG